MKKNIISFAITMVMLLMISGSASARCYVCMNDLVGGGRGCWYANTICEDKGWLTYSKERDLKCTNIYRFATIEYVSYDKPTGHAWVVSGEERTPIVAKNNIMLLLTKNDPGPISIDELNEFIDGTTLKIVETTSTVDKNGSPPSLQTIHRDANGTGRPSSGGYGSGGGSTPPWIDPSLKPMMYIGGSMNMPTGASKNNALIPLCAGVDASAYFPLMGRGFGSKVRSYLTFGLNVGGNYSANVKKPAEADYKAIDITGQSSAPIAIVQWGETSSTVAFDAGPQVNFSVGGFILSPILNLGYMNISSSSVSVSQTTSFTDTTQAPISIDLYSQKVKGSGLTVIPKLRVAYFFGKSGIGVWAEGAYNYSPNITIETTRFVPNENPNNPGVYDIGLIQEGTEVTTHSNFNYNGFSAKVGICFALELSKKHRPWVDCAQEPASDIFDRWGNLKRSTSVDNVNPNDTVPGAGKAAKEYIKCKCKDKVGTYNRTCYSTKDCDVCCGFKLSYPGDNGTVTEGYEGDKKGIILPGRLEDVPNKPEDEPSKTENKDKNNNKRQAVNLIFTDGSYSSDPVHNGGPQEVICRGSGICFSGSGAQKINPFHITKEIGVKLNGRDVIGAFILNDNSLDIELLTVPTEKSKKFIVSEKIDLNSSICGLLGANSSITIEAGEYAIDYTKNPFGGIKLKVSKGFPQLPNAIFDRWGDLYYTDGDMIIFPNDCNDSNAVDSSNGNMNKRPKYFLHVGCSPDYIIRRCSCDVGTDMKQCARDFCNSIRKTDYSDKK